MKMIQMTDNSSKNLSDIDISNKENLSKIANQKIAELTLEENPNLLVFPRDLNRYGDGISENCIISMHDDKISTGNIMGFVGVKDTQLDIKSRFAKDCPQDYFLHYMLQKVFSINLFDIKHTTNQEQIFDFLLYLFPHFLKKALAQGLFKKYKRYEYNDANVRGPIDVNRHIRQNIPFKGTVAYSTREHSYDNEVTQLVRHTIEYIRTKEQGSAILNNDLETKTCVSQITMATQTYNLRDRNKIINQNLRPMRHPYYSAYTELQKICLQILRHESLKYGQEKDKIYGILFDGAWLWEEYLYTILKECGFKHPRNKTEENPIRIWKNNPRYPDFYKGVQIRDFKYGDAIPEENMILDAKYKQLDYTSIDRNDAHQIVTYMHILPAIKGGLIYPRKENKENPLYSVLGIGGQISLIGVTVQHPFGENRQEEQANARRCAGAVYH